MYLAAGIPLSGIAPGTAIGGQRCAGRRAGRRHRLLLEDTSQIRNRRNGSRHARKAEHPRARSRVTRLHLFIAGHHHAVRRRRGGGSRRCPSKQIFHAILFRSEHEHAVEVHHLVGGRIVRADLLARPRASTRSPCMRCTATGWCALTWERHGRRSRPRRHACRMRTRDSIRTMTCRCPKSCANRNKRRRRRKRRAATRPFHVINTAFNIVRRVGRASRVAGTQGGVIHDDAATHRQPTHAVIAGRDRSADAPTSTKNPSYRGASPSDGP